MTRIFEFEIIEFDHFAVYICVTCRCVYLCNVIVMLTFEKFAPEGNAAHDI